MTVVCMKTFYKGINVAPSGLAIAAPQELNENQTV